MRVIYPSEIQESIDRISRAGVNVDRKTHVIYMRDTITVTPEKYPLEIIVTDKLPKGIDAMVAKRQKAYASKY